MIIRIIPIGCHLSKIMMWYLELKRVEKMVSHARNQIYTRAKQERNEEREIIGEREREEK